MTHASTTTVYTVSLQRTAMLAPLNIKVPALNAQHKEALWPLEEQKQEQ
jgi:hypothetical protein